MLNTQKEQVFNHLKEHGSLTSWDAITRYHITRLSEYIHQLRNEGLRVEDVWETDGIKHWKRYLLRETPFKILGNGQYSIV